MYVTQPPSFEIKGKEDMVYKLKNAIYGLTLEKGIGSDGREWMEKGNKKL